jgi:hypothetical protein
MGTKKSKPKFHLQTYLDNIHATLQRICQHEKVAQLTELQAIQIQPYLTKLLTQDELICLQLYMTRTVIDIHWMVDMIGCELNKPISIQAVQDYRYTLLDYYRKKVGQ